MQRKKVFERIAMAQLLFFAATACSETDQERDVAVSKGFIETADNTIVLDTVALDAISGYDDDGNLTFSKTPSLLTAAKAGDILVVGSCDAIPTGALVQIENITKNGTALALQTAPAKLNQAIANADLSVHKKVNADSIHRFNGLKHGVSLREVNPRQTDGIALETKTSALSSGEEIVIDLDNTVLVDADGDMSTQYDQILVDGDITISPEFEFTLKIEDFEFKEILFRNDTSEVADLVISNSDITNPVVEFSEEIEVAVFSFAPIVFDIGGVPVVITPVLNTSIGVDGAVAYEVSVGLRQTADIELGVHYSDDEWTPISSVELGFGIMDPSISAACDVRGFVTPEFSLLLYGVVGPYVDVEGYVKLSVDGEATVVDEFVAEYSENQFTVTDDLNGAFEGFLHWKLSGGLMAHIGFQLSLMSISSLDLEFDIYQWEQTIHEGLLSGMLVYDENGIVDTSYDIDLYTVEF